MSASMLAIAETGTTASASPRRFLRLVAFTNDPLWRYEQKGEIKPRYYNPGDLFDEVHLVTPASRESAPEPLQELVGRARLVIHPMGRLNPVRLPWQLWRSARLVRTLNPDVVRGYGTSFGGLLAVWAGRRNRLPVVISLHSHGDLDVKGLLRRGRLPLSVRNVLRAAWLRLTERRIIAGADAVICRYEALRSYAFAHGARRTEVIYNGVDIERFRPADGPRPEAGPRPRLMVLSVNRQDPEKNPESLIRAVQGLDVHLVLIGQGSLHPRLRRVAEACGLADRVTFVPSVRHDVIHQYYQRADIYAVAIDMVGLSMGTMEAMACGLPIVYGRTLWEDSPELLQDAAMMVEPTPEGFREALTALAQDPALRARLGASGRQRLLAIRPERMEAREREIYTELLTVTRERE